MSLLNLKSMLSGWIRYSLLILRHHLTESHSDHLLIQISSNRKLLSLSLTKQVVNLMEISDEDDLYEALKSFVEMMYFRYLAINPKDRKAIICESPFYSTAFRNTLIKVFFEHFDVSFDEFYKAD